MRRIAGELADGTLTWMTGPRALGGTLVPEIRAAASRAGRPAPRIVAGLPIALTNDPAAAREAASKLFALYGTLPSYRAMLDLEGAAAPGDIVIAGDERAIESAIRSLASAGVSDLSAAPYPFGSDGAAAVKRTTALLAELAKRSLMSRELRFETRAIHAGQEPDEATGATIVPVYQTVTFTQEAVGQHRGFEYSRSGNPTRAALEACLASLEGGRFGFAYASGMAAISGVMQLLSAGDHVVVADDLYGGSYRLFTQVMPRFGVRFSFVDATRPEEIDKAFEPATRMLWIESPTNPLLRLVDIAACGEIARRRGAQLVVDNTFATPFLQNPLALGAHVALHSTTKYIGGHSDVIGGAVVVDDEELAKRLQFTRNATGGVPGPWDAWLTLRGAKTLALRMREHERNAAQRRGVPARAGRRSRRSTTRACRSIPGTSSRAARCAASAACSRSSCAAAPRRRSKLCESTRLFALGESLGGVESLIGYPWSMSHAAFPPEEKRRKGVSEAVVRLSVGIEHADDLCADLGQALEQAARAG